MKKLILLLFIPLVFTCNDNDEGNNFRDYLNSNIFSYQGLACITQAIWPPIPCGEEDIAETFIEFTLSDEIGIGWNLYGFYDYPFYCEPNIDTSQCYKLYNSGEGLIITESQNEIIWYKIDTGVLYKIVQNGDSLNISPLINQDIVELAPFPYAEYVLTNEQDLNQKIIDRNNYQCPPSCPIY